MTKKDGYYYFRLTDLDGRHDFVSYHETELNVFYEFVLENELTFKEIDVHVYNYEQEKRHGMDDGYGGPIDVGCGYGW